MKNTILLFAFILTTNILLSQRQVSGPTNPVGPFTPIEPFGPIVLTPCLGCDLSNVHINFNGVENGCEVIFATYLANLPENCNGSYSYTFGDGSPASEGHLIDDLSCVTQEYDNNGTFEACMTYEVNQFCSISECIDVTVLDCDDCPICSLIVDEPTIIWSDGTEVTFDAGVFSSGSCPEMTVEYDYGDETTGTSGDHTYDSPGSYNVCVTASVISPNDNICSEEVCNYLHVGLISDDSKEVSNKGENLRLKANNDLNIFPNPVKDKVNINIGSQNIKAMGLISITDFNGKTLFLEKIDQITDPINIDVSNFPVGIYFIKFESTKGETTYKKIQKI